MAIKFYSTEGKYGCFSNFSAHGFELDGAYWPTSEHYFQAMKFEGTPHVDDIRTAKTPGSAASRGRDRKRPLRADWEEVKEDVMRRALRAKFDAHPGIRDILMETIEVLIENAPKDYYWGCGASGSGRNRLGVLLMELRDEIAGRAPSP